VLNQACTSISTNSNKNTEEARIQILANANNFAVDEDELFKDAPKGDKDTEPLPELPSSVAA